MCDHCQKQIIRHYSDRQIVFNVKLITLYNFLQPQPTRCFPTRRSGGCMTGWAMRRSKRMKALQTLSQASTSTSTICSRPPSTMTIFFWTSRIPTGDFSRARTARSNVTVFAGQTSLGQWTALMGMKMRMSSSFFR